MDRDFIELKELYGIKEVQGGKFETGFKACLNHMHKECERLKNIINEKDKIITHFTRGTKREKHYG
jgi:hypothetical protein